MRIALLLSACLLASTADARRCVLNGVEVNPDNGSTTAGQTGVLTCYRDDGSLWYEQALKNGKHLGLDRFHDEDGSVRERSVNAQGNTEGIAREWYPGGQLKTEGDYRNATPVGVHRSFHPDGKPQSVRIYVEKERAAALAIEWDAEGRLRDLACATRSLIELDRPLCGHGRPVTVKLYDRRGHVIEVRSMDAGQVRKSEQYDGEGHLSASVEFRDDGRTELEFHPNGERARERVIAGDYRIRESEWYMNGALKSLTTHEPAERNARTLTESFSDSGKLSQREVRIDGHPQKRERFDAAARLVEDWEYAPEGHVGRHRKLDANGSVLLDEELYPDGSRKVLKAEAAIGG